MSDLGLAIRVLRAAGDCPSHWSEAQVVEWAAGEILLLRASLRRSAWAEIDEVFEQLFSQVTARPDPLSSVVIEEVMDAEEVLTELRRIDAKDLMQAAGAYEAHLNRKVRG